MTVWSRLLICAFIAPALLAGAAAQAQEPENIGREQDWYAYQFMEGGNRVCFIASVPQRSEYSQDIVGRGDTFVLVTQRPAEGTRDVVSFYAGFPFRQGSSATVTVDGEDQYTLFTDGEVAWTEGPNTDRALVESMLAGGEMVVRSTSGRGTTVTDVYSLFGATAMRELSLEACGL